MEVFETDEEPLGEEGSRDRAAARGQDQPAAARRQACDVPDVAFAAGGRSGAQPSPRPLLLDRCFCYAKREKDSFLTHLANKSGQIGANA